MTTAQYALLVAIVACIVPSAIVAFASRDAQRKRPTFESAPRENLAAVRAAEERPSFPIERYHLAAFCDDPSCMLCAVGGPTIHNGEPARYKRAQVVDADADCDVGPTYPICAAFDATGIANASFERAANLWGTRPTAIPLPDVHPGREA